MTSVHKLVRLHVLGPNYSYAVPLGIATFANKQRHIMHLNDMSMMRIFFWTLGFRFTFKLA